MNYDLRQMATFGVAGNFTGHLEQAGEAKDFSNIATKDNNAPKAIFPTYLPIKNNSIPTFLLTFPFDSNKIIFPKNEENLQIEPECAIVCNVTWNNNKIENIHPIAFAASNNCSIRKDGAKKISQKKNWGNSSKGISDNLIQLDNFSENGIINECIPENISLLLLFSHWGGNDMDAGGCGRIFAPAAILSRQHLVAPVRGHRRWTLGRRNSALHPAAKSRNRRRCPALGALSFLFFRPYRWKPGTAPDEFHEHTVVCALGTPGRRVVPPGLDAEKTAHFYAS